MSHLVLPALFCIAEEAKPFVRKFMTLGKPSRHVARFIASRSRPNISNELKLELDDDEPIDTDFIGASHQECQQWALEVGVQLKNVRETVLFIADARSAEDDTVSMQYYPVREPFTYEKFGPLPPAMNRWYEWRIDYRDVFEVKAALTCGVYDVVDPTYYGLKNELTDERGIFNVAEATALISGSDMERLGDVVTWDGLGPNL